MERRSPLRRLVFQYGTVKDFIPVMCPYCGAQVELDVEETGWARQSYVQDCPICCQPWQVELTRDAYGDWEAVVKTGDE